ncbi:MAG: PKD domain-containing protein [bacterium]|nr:PKD domain-containing protein [bacterium]
MNTKRTNLLLILCLLFTKINAECVLVPLSLSERVNAASLITEGKVIGIKSYWNADKTMIYTANTVAISKVYKGMSQINSGTIDIITLGGTVEDKAIKVDPELEMAMGEIGILLLIEKDGQWVAESGPQGFIKIDKTDASASDIFNHYPPYTIYGMIENLTNQKAINVNVNLTKIVFSTKRAAATITSISPKTINAGTTSTLTIKGTNFNSTIDTSSVMFKNGDDGGASYIKALKKDYISWTDTMIKVLVRTKAGTGKIRVVVGGNGVATSADTLQIPYAHLNVVQGVNADSIGFETQEIGMNASNGITWKINKRFYDSLGAKGAFVRSLERWRCGTYINWDTLGKVSYSTIKSDGVNMCAWDTSGAMPNGVLAQCFSFWSGCSSGPTLKWFVIELDIRFRLRPTNTTNWSYTIGTASASQYHFETVATHELGHGHQLGHVIAPAVVMHYAISNGQVKPSLTVPDIAGGTYVITKSATAICGKNAHSKLNSGNCAIVAPSANFILPKSTVCLNESINLTDSSKGNLTAYAWNFGSGASPASATTVGPHAITYSTSGTKTITLTVTTSTGSNVVKSKTLAVKSDSKMKPNFTWVAAEKGKVTFTNTSNNSTSDKWYFGDLDSALIASPLHNYAAGGTYNVRLISTNTCNTEDTIKSIKFAYLNFYNNPKQVCIGQTVTYTDSSDVNVATRQWTFTGGTPATANTAGPHKVSYNSSGVKGATLAITVTGGQAQTYTISNTATVSADTFVKANFTYGYIGSNIVGFNNTSTGSNMTYKWYFGDGDSSTLKNPVHQYVNANNKTVRLIVNGACNSNDTVIVTKDFTNLSAIQQSEVFKIYPNPSAEYVHVISAFNTPIELKITDLSGRVVLQYQGENQPLFIGNLANGIYMVKIISNGAEANIKLEVQH